MWEKYSFGAKNAEKLNSKFNGKGKSENVLGNSLYRLFVNSAQNNSVCDGNADCILSFISFNASDDVKQEPQLPIPEYTVDEIKPITSDIKCQVNELKDILKRAEGNTPDINVIIKLIGNIFSNINPQQVIDVCNCLELHKLDEAAFHSHFCQLFLQVAPPIGFSIGLSLIQQLLYSQIIDLKVPASRLLTLTVLEWSKTFPKVIIEGVIIPCIKENHLEKFQVDLLIRILKDGLPLTHMAICLRECLQVFNTIEERHFLIIQTIIEKKVNFEDCWDVLLDKLLSVSEKHKKSITFTKLLLLLLTKQEYQAQPRHLTVLAKIVKRNETFLKKSTEKALEHLTEKYSNA